MPRFISALATCKTGAALVVYSLNINFSGTVRLWDWESTRFTHLHLSIH